MKKDKKQEAKEIVIEPLNLKMLKVKVASLEGSTYIANRLSVAKVKEITAREFGEKKVKKFRNLDKEYEDCFYHVGNNGKYGILSASFYKAMEDAAVAAGYNKTQIKRAVMVLGEFCLLEYEKMERREDVVRRAGIGSPPDVRVRPEFFNWKTEICIQYDANQISADQLVNLVNTSGFTTGVGDWRKQKSGNHGMFKVVG